MKRRGFLGVAGGSLGVLIASTSIAAKGVCSLMDPIITPELHLEAFNALISGEKLTPETKQRYISVLIRAMDEAGVKRYI